MGKPRGFPNGNFSKLKSRAPALFFCRTTRAHARVKRTRLTQPSGSRAGNPRRACSSGLACRSGFHTLEVIPPAICYCLTHWPPSNLPRWRCSKVMGEQLWQDFHASDGTASAQSSCTMPTEARTFALASA
ncbi:hypothetical protein ACFX2B_013768 [Malus domestica]